MSEAVAEHVSLYARPLATGKNEKRVLKLAKKATRRKQIKRGIKEVVKAIRKGSKGLCILAGDISPLDVISHLPVYCEENGIPYIFVPSKEKLGTAALSKRITSCIMVLEAAAGSELHERYNESVETVKQLTAQQ
eukprot:TRINITY_DN15673_c0_g1_i1.p1 TRINITY_DN15673_c0_g1~~TRINITY_DN15673_c0_g1_i1.p1  ORF type:complete len:135 (-),score=23.65 TRINITY_DN15673_c0_g1_i1:20-424(-)